MHKNRIAHHVLDCAVHASGAQLFYLDTATVVMIKQNGDVLVGKLLTVLAYKKPEKKTVVDGT